MAQQAPLLEWCNRLMAVQAQRFVFTVPAMVGASMAAAQWLKVPNTKRFKQSVLGGSVAQFAHNKYLQLTQRSAPAS